MTFKTDLTNQTTYTKTAGSNQATLTYFVQQEKPYAVVTPVKSKWFKTRTGAEKFLAREGYEKGVGK